MLDVASSLSRVFSFVRIDMYSGGKTCDVGEITNCRKHTTGMFMPRSAEKAVSQIIFGKAVLAHEVGELTP